MKARIRSTRSTNLAKHSRFRSTLKELPLWPALSRIRVRPEFRSASAPILERRAACDLKVIVAGLAPDVILPVIGAAFANRLAVQESDFARVIHAIPRLTRDLIWQIFSIPVSYTHL